MVEFFDGSVQDSYDTSSAIQEMLGLCIGRNTGAMFDDHGQVIGGNATDKALLNYLTQARFDALKAVEIEQAQQFNSANKYSAAQIQGKTYYKGAPERLLANATHYLDASGEKQPLDLSIINQKIDQLAEKSMRVLSFAYSESLLVENE